MPRITINGREMDFEKGQTILQVALDNDIEIPHYCFHPGLTIPANCRICLAEIWQPNPRNNNALEVIPKLMPTCQTTAVEGQVVRTDTPKAIANQKAVMEYLLINHPVDCPVCDQAGECYLQDYSYQYGRSVSRFKEAKIKQPKKDLGPHVLLYSDRCIMCTRCVRFTREVTGTNELMVMGRGATSQIDIFPGKPIDNELSGNVIDICPVGALLDKDFLFKQRVWFLKRAASIDPLTSSGDNIWVEHNEGKVYRIKPRTNMDVNKWWITDEVRYGWKFVHDENRLTMPRVKAREDFDPTQAAAAWSAAYETINQELEGKRIAAVISPMLSCEDVYLLATWVLSIDANAAFIIGPVPFSGEDKTFPGGFTARAEKAPNARGVKRVLQALSSNVSAFDSAAASSRSADAVIVTGNYPSDWITKELLGLAQGKFTIAIDTLANQLTHGADVVLPGATWAEKSGTFENVAGRLQAFERAINPIDFCKSESQIALDLAVLHDGGRAEPFDAARIRARMADLHGLREFTTDLHVPLEARHVESDMQIVEL
jgi:NADH-quinone oxidoreductase subunit G